MPFTSATSCSCDIGRVSGCLIITVTDGSSSSDCWLAADLAACWRLAFGCFGADGEAVAAAVRGSGGSPSVQSLPFAFVVGLVGNSEVLSSRRAGVSQPPSSSPASLSELDGDFRRLAAGSALSPAVSALRRRGAGGSAKSADVALSPASGCWRSLAELVAGASL